MATRVFQIRLRDIGLQAAFEPAAQPGFQSRDLLRWSITADHDLTAAGVEVIEGVEELLLRTFFAADKLDIVDQKQVHLPVLVAILFGVLLAKWR